MSSLTALSPGVNLEHKTDHRKFFKLDCLDQPGVTEKEFWGFFVKCDACRLVMTQEVFPDNYCLLLGEDGLELDVPTDEE